MKLKTLTAALAALISTQSAYAQVQLDDFIEQAIANSYKIRSLLATHDVAKIEADREDRHYLPSFSIDHTLKTNMMDHPDGGIRLWEGREQESNINLTSNIWRDNHDSVYEMLSTDAQIAGVDVDIEKSNIHAQIATQVYSIALYERLIQEGVEILSKAKQIDADIKRKVAGGVAKASEATTAQVLITDMENAILATNLKIKQLKLNVEQTSGSPYPEDLVVDLSEVDRLVNKIPCNDVTRNKTLIKKQLEVHSAKKTIETTTNWMSVDVYAKSNAANFTYSKSDTEVGVTVTMNLFNPNDYWKEKTSTYEYTSQQYMLEQVHEDLKLSLESQKSIQSSNQKLLASQLDSIGIKRDLILERQNEYQINATSLYELIQAWNGYYLALQQKVDTEVTLVNTMMSIDVITGDI